MEVILLIELYLLEQFDAFARIGTLSGAAEELHITQPALTRSMHKLEEEFGISLFIRDKKRLSLTPAGKVVANYAARILEDEQEMLLRAIETDRRDRTLNLGSCGLLSINRIVPILTQNFPDKSILTEVNTDENILRQLHNQTYQLGILHGLPKDKSIFSQRYISEQIYISVPLDHPLASKESLKKEDLKKSSVLTFDVGFWVQLFKDKMPDTSFYIQNDVDAMDELVEASSLLVFNSNQMIADGYTSESRVNIVLDEPFASTTYYLACLDSEKNKYDSLFNSLRWEAITC
ncbi:MAG: LysR family transcriptional regulator [Butyrivibrio sp.]|nr:LysR family transcriptional regulator [Butyrivibrio sp.]